MKSGAPLRERGKSPSPSPAGQVWGVPGKVPETTRKKGEVPQQGSFKSPRTPPLSTSLELGSPLAEGDALHGWATGPSWTPELPQRPGLMLASWEHLRPFGFRQPDRPGCLWQLKGLLQPGWGTLRVWRSAPAWRRAREGGRCA